MPDKPKPKVKVQKIDPKLYQDLKFSLKELYGDKCVERTKKAVTRKGYDTIGYGYQFVANRLNEVLPKFGLTWQPQGEPKVVRDYPAKSGTTNFEAVCGLTILFLDKDRNVVDSKSCCGGHQSRNHSDALKGAFTNAFKKTAALFGVGADAYEGTIDEDYKPVDEPNTKPATSSYLPELTDEERKGIEKAVTAIGKAETKAELKRLEEAVGNLVGTKSGKQIAYLRKLIEVQVKKI